MSGAIEKAIQHLDHDRGKESQLQHEVIGPARAELAAMRAKADWHDRGMDTVAGWVGKRETHIVDHICCLGFERDRLDKECASLREENARLREALSLLHVRAENLCIVAREAVAGAASGNFVITAVLQVESLLPKDEVRSATEG